MIRFPSLPNADWPRWCDLHRRLANRFRRRGRLFGDGQHGRIYRVTWAGGDVPGAEKETPAIERRAMNSWAEVLKKTDAELLGLLGSEDSTIRDVVRSELVRRGEKNRVAFGVGCG